MGADVNVITSKKYTALHHAAEKGHAAIVDILLKNGAATDVIDNKGRSALVIAEQCCHDKVVTILQPYTLKVEHETLLEMKTAPIEAKESVQVENLPTSLETSQAATVVMVETPLKNEKLEKFTQEITVKITDSGVSAELIDMVSKLSENNNKGFSMLHIVSKYNNKEMAGMNFTRTKLQILFALIRAAIFFAILWYQPISLFWKKKKFIDHLFKSYAMLRTI